MGQGHQSGLRVRAVEGEPLAVEGWTLVPVARVATFSRGRGTLAGGGGESGWAVGVAQVTPRAVVADGPRGRQRIPIRDATQQMVVGMLGQAAALTLLLAGVRWWLRRRACRAAIERSRSCL